MGAAGLTCSTSEMAANSGTGIEIELDLVPQREEGMTPYEIMLSESQERMLAIVKRGYEDKVKAIFDKWDLRSDIIGEVTDDARRVLLVEQDGSESVLAHRPDAVRDHKPPRFGLERGSAVAELRDLPGALGRLDHLALVPEADVYLGIRIGKERPIVAV